MKPAAGPEAPAPLAVEVAGAALPAYPVDLGDGEAGWRVDEVRPLTVGGVAVMARIHVELAPHAVEAVDPPGSFFGQRDEAHLDALRAAAVRTALLVRGGSTIVFRLELEGPRRAALKPLQINPQTVPRYEVAAYRLNRLLGCTNVPPAMLRRLHRNELWPRKGQLAEHLVPRIEAEVRFDADGYTEGAISAWVGRMSEAPCASLAGLQRWLGWCELGGEPPPDYAPLLGQLSSVLIFDLLMNNPDRFVGGNLFLSAGGTKLLWLDNAFAFQDSARYRARCFGYLSRCQRFSRTTVEALRALDAAALDRELGGASPLLTDEERAGILARREQALGHIDALVAGESAARVLAFP